MKNKVGTLITLVLITILVGACSSSSSNVPSLTDKQETELKEEETFADEEKVMAFTECMSENGIEYMDPTVDSDGNIQKPEPVDGADLKREDVQEFYEICGVFLEDLSFGGKREDISETVDQYVELAICLRDVGYDVDDPTTENIKQWFQDFRATYVWDDADALDAYETCSKENGGVGGKSGGGK